MADVNMHIHDFDSLSDSFLIFCWQSLPPRERARVLAGSPRTVWFFGAGASHHYNFNSRGVPVPLANGFFEAFNALPTSEGFHANVGPFISYLRSSRGVRAEDVHLWRENIETFMTSIEEELAALKDKKSVGSFGADDMSQSFSAAAVFNKLGFILANVVNEAQNGSSESLYQYLLEFSSPDDVFITFNWDTLLDRALAASGGWSPNDGYGLSFSAVLDGTWKQAAEGRAHYATNWKLLKLHGSTNWLVPMTHVHFQTLDLVSSVPDSDRVFLYWQSSFHYETHRSRWRGGYAPTCYCYYPPNLPMAYFQETEIAAKPGYVFVKMAPKGVYAAFDEPEGQGIPASAVMITPVRQKKYDMYQAAINSIWTQSADALGTTDKVVIIGYSFPQTDTRALELLSSALAARPNAITVEVVAPDASDIVSRIGAPLANAKSVTPHNMTFEDYLSILAGHIPTMMKTAAADYKEVREWAERIFRMGQLTSARQQGTIKLE